MTNKEIFKQDISLIWNPERFNLIREPLIVKNYENLFFKETMSCLDMPIKMAKSRQILLPEEYEQNNSIKQIINDALKFEMKINPDWQEYYMYLTYHRTEVKKGATQRIAGWHIDGMQGQNYPEKLKSCHSYLLSDVIPTEFAIQSFDATKLSYIKDNWFNALGQQVKIKNIKTYGLNQLVAMSAYQVHQSGTAQKKTLKNFIRIEFSLKQFNRIGNTENPLIKTGWVYIKRNIPNFN